MAAAVLFSISYYILLVLYYYLSCFSLLVIFQLLLCETFSMMGFELVYYFQFQMILARKC